MDAMGSKSMILIGIPNVGTQPNRLGGATNNGEEYDSRTNDNVSTDVELGVGEAFNNSDYQTPPPRLPTEGGRGGGREGLGILYLERIVMNPIT